MSSFRNVKDGQVIFNLRPDAQCPCGSGVPTASCCLTSRGLRRRPASALPCRSKTGNSVNRCYAKELRDCGNKISREHYVSASILNYLNAEDGLAVKGFPWASSQFVRISPNALASKILCDRHNSVLSPLDSIADQLFRAFDERDVVGDGRSLLCIFNGNDIERWLLKILCGLVTSRVIAPEFLADLSIPDYWLRVLFMGAQLPDGQGLYVCKSKGHHFSGPTGLAIRVILGGGKLTGVGVTICGYELILSMNGFPSRKFDGREFVYRPLEVYFAASGFEKSILFTWDGLADLGTISVSNDAP